MPFKRQVEITTPAEDPEFVRCMDYILRRELGIIEEVTDQKGTRQVIKRYNMKEYAALHDVHPNSVYNWLDKWTKSGLLKSCREMMMIPMGEEVVVANRRLLTAWPEMIDRAIKIAINGQSDQFAQRTMEWLYRDIIQPMMRTQVDPGHEEADYIESKSKSENPFDPLLISK